MARHAHCSNPFPVPAALCQGAENAERAQRIRAQILEKLALMKKAQAEWLVLGLVVDF